MKAKTAKSMRDTIYIIEFFPQILRVLFFFFFNADVRTYFLYQKDV